MLNRPLAATLTAIALATACVLPASAATLKKPELDKLVAAEQAKASPDFRAFLAAAAKADPQLKTAVAAYRSKKQLAGDDLTNISRLLGLWNRLHNQKAVLATLEKMVEIPTVRDEKVPPHQSPAIIAFGTLVEGMARDFGLAYRNVDNRIFEVKLEGKGTGEFGILTHADVVPVVADEWVLDDGRKIDPFKVTRVGDFLYGRGTIDDKGSIAATLYAMKTVKESGLPLDRTIRLMIETTEETGGDAMKYYREKTPLPDYNIVLDSKYPAVVAEKGSGALKVFFPVEAAPADQTAITAMAGAAAANAVPQTATATLKGGDRAAAAAKLEGTKAAFIQKYEGQGGKFSIDITQGRRHHRGQGHRCVGARLAARRRREPAAAPRPLFASFRASRWPTTTMPRRCATWTTSTPRATSARRWAWATATTSWARSPCRRTSFARRTASSR